MAIEPRLVTPEFEEEYDEIEIEEPLEGEADFDDEIEPEPDAIPHDMNLADIMDERELAEISGGLREDFEADKRSRSDWAAAYVKGMDLLGMKIEDRNQPWEGASGVFHPVLTETIIRFQRPSPAYRAGTELPVDREDGGLPGRDGADAVPPPHGGFRLQEGLLQSNHRVPDLLLCPC